MLKVNSVFVSMIFVLSVGTTSTVSMAASSATAQFVNPEGDTVGEASLTQNNLDDGVVITVEISGLSPGKHAIHIHSIGSCEPNFKASGGHINTAGNRAHGLLNQEGPDNGDLPNLFAAENGIAKAEFYTTAVTIGPGSSGLFDADGSALVVHAGGDDHVTQPIGGAGGRVACGVIQQNQGGY